MIPNAKEAKPMNIGGRVGGLVPRQRTIASSAPTSSHFAAPPRPSGSRPRAPSFDPPEFNLPPSPPIFSALPKETRAKTDKNYRLAYISSSCPDVNNFMPPLIESTEEGRNFGMPDPIATSSSNVNPLRKESLTTDPPPVLGSSPTIMYVLKTMPGSLTNNQNTPMQHSSRFTPEGGRGSHDRQGPIVGSHNHSPIHMEREDDDDLVFGPLSLENEGGYLEGPPVGDQLNFMNFNL